MTYDGTTARVYANAVEEGSTIITLDTTDGFNLFSGLWDQGPGGATIDFFDGQVQDLRVYNRELSVPELQAIYMSRGKDGIVRGLQGRWPFTDGAIGSSPASTFVSDEEDNVGSAASIALSIPTNSDGDLLLACICPGGDASGTPANVTTPSGWTFVATVDSPAALSTPSLWLYEREASSDTTPGTYTFSVNQTCTIVAHMNCYQNVTTTNDVSGTNNGTSASAICPSATVTDANGPYLVVRFVGADNGALDADPWPLGVNQRNLTEDTGVGNGCGLVCGDHIRSASTTGTKAFSMASDTWCALTVAYKATLPIKDVAGGTSHPHDADPQFTVSRVEGELRIG
jgi:hypothetical protein